MIHPYDLNSNNYNFFFHPLHQTTAPKANKKLFAFSIITHIALSILTAMTWQIVFWAVNLYDGRAVKIWKEHNTPEKLLAIQETFSKPCAKKIEKTGLIGHGTNTCFLAASIQLCRQLPSVRKTLTCELQLSENESQETFLKRRNVQHALQDILYRSENGQNISGLEMNNFHKIMHRYSPVSISAPGQAGETPKTFHCLLQALSHPTINSFTEQETIEKISLTPILRDRKVNKATFPHLISKDFEHIKEFKIKDLVLKHTFKILEDPSKRTTYVLAGIAGHGDGHSIAYVKDLTFSSEDYILCDDLSSKHKVEKIEKSMSSHQFLLIYTQV